MGKNSGGGGWWEGPHRPRGTGEIGHAARSRWSRRRNCERRFVSCVGCVQLRDRNRIGHRWRHERRRRGASSVTRAVFWRRRIEGGSTALPEARQNLQSAVTVSRQQPNLGLIILDRFHRIVAYAPIGAAGIEARFGEAGLHLLDFREGQRSLRARERVNERRSTQYAIAKMTDRKRVVHRWVVTPDGIEVGSKQKAWAALHRHPHLRARIRLRKSLAIGSRYAGACPSGVAAAATGAASRSAHLIAPMLATVIFAPVEQIPRGGAQRVVGLAERRHPAVTIVVNPDIEPDLRHPLRVSHRAGPGPAHLFRRAPAAIHYPKCVDQFGLPIGAPAWLVPRERRQRWKYRPHVVLLHERIAERGLYSPERQQRASLDAIILFDAREQRLVLPQRFLARNHTPVRYPAIDVLPDLFVELRLVTHLLEHGHVRLDPAHHASPGCVRNALGQCSGAEIVAPLFEAGRCGGKGDRGMREKGAGRQTGSQQ